MNVFKRAKIITIVFVLLFFLYFTNDFNIINIEKTALIVALALDKSQDEYEITAQIAVPQASDTSQGNSESVISAKSNSIYTAIEKISEETGWHPRLSFCNLVLIGEDLLSENVINLIDFFLRTYKIEDSAILCATEGKAKEILLASSPLDNISSFALSKIFVREFDNASAVMTTTIKNFAIGGYSKSNYGYMPLVKKIQTEDKTDVKASSVTLTANSDSSGGSTGSGGDKSGSGGSGGDKPCVFDATTTLLFHDGYFVGKLDKEQSLFFSLISKDVSEAYFTISATDDFGNNGEYVVFANQVSHSLNLNFNGEKPTLNGTLELWLKVVDSNANQNIKDYSNLGKLNESMKVNAEKYATEKLYSTFTAIKSSGSDGFETLNKLYRYYPKKYAEHSDSIKNNIEANFTVKCYNFN